MQRYTITIMMALAGACSFDHAPIRGDLALDVDATVELEGFAGMGGEPTVDAGVVLEDGGRRGGSKILPLWLRRDGSVPGLDAALQDPDGGAGVDAGPATPPDAGNACVPNVCGGCAELGCPPGFTGSCEYMAPCETCPPGCYHLAVGGVPDVFWCDGPDKLACLTCSCEDA